MKSLIWKECQENLKWAALTMLLAGGSMYLALSSVVQRPGSRSSFHTAT
jgi:hypothetical protein